ncbi:MAG: hypothetical protein JSS41_11275 [Proteobacteria bacterium]|nr:hypothetical protein [Pseudomonadota bacterium]
MISNPYQPPASPVLPACDVIARRIGLRVGCGFAAPWLALLGLELLGVDKTATSVALNCFALATMIGLSIGSGGWWGSRAATMRWPWMLAVALAMAWLWVLGFFGVMWAGFALEFHGDIGIDAKALPIYMTGLGAGWIVSIAMGCVVRWRVRRASRRLRADRDSSNR